MFDPPRHDTKATIQDARRMGVQVKMITGDQRAIAIETARQLGMGAEIIGNEVRTIMRFGCSSGPGVQPI